MQLFYQENLSASDQTFTFNKEESKHIIKVLRKKEGDVLKITNGQGYLFTAEITLGNDKKCAITIIKSEHFSKKRNYHLHIAIAPTKMNDRLEWFLEKATEIGVDEITPILCDNSERKIIKKERFEKVIVSAMKQSLQLYLPKLNDLTTYNHLIKTTTAQTKFIAHCEDSEKNLLKEQNLKSSNYLVLIGPEGDFSTPEINSALQHQFIPLSLGENRLRTETAGIVICNTLAVLKQ